MIWSLFKIIFFIAAVAVLTLGARYLAESGGSVRIAVANIEFNFGPLQAVVAVVVLLIALWLVLKILSFLGAAVRFLNGDETALSRYFNRNRERRGFEALSEGMTALASGEGRVAMSKAAKAEKYLGRPELTNLITAQAAEMTGDRKKATEVYKRLLEDDRTRFVGVRGIMKQKLEDGETEVAMKLAERAFALKPRHTETGDVLLRLQAEQEDWKGARETLALKQRHGALPRDVHKRRDAVLALSEAREVFRNGSTVEAREEAIEANRLSPDLVPAAVMAAQAYITDGRSRFAARVLKTAWEARPHPDLAAAFASIMPEEEANARVKRFQGLVKNDPDHPEARMLMAELHIAAKDYEAARKSVAELVESDPTARTLTIMAAIERGEGSDDDVVRGWLTRAVTASRGPQWVCENCQTVHSAWGPVCINCDGFDTMTWTVPVEGEVAMPASSEMLPLIVGLPEVDAVEEGEPETTPEGVVHMPDDPGDKE
ncbi:MAG: tetratricopeptide repeat protein [Marinosulfonomonas sp.]|nr:tetratricopeptide repeat protein [Marinosulfonomonas sp.]